MIYDKVQGRGIDIDILDHKIVVDHITSNDFD